jgi:tRNA (guanine26-N2/guanine27-N2)-dimethyltransferase
MKMLTEGSVSFSAPVQKVVSKDMDVFYNPVMQLNRDLAVLLLKVGGRKQLAIADPLAGSGIRALRFLKELPKGSIQEIAVNDSNPKFSSLFKQQLKRNKLGTKNVTIHQQDAVKFLLDSKGFDYIDIDPFGSPNSFLDAACKRIARDGILAVTATDTGALAGSFPDACRRKYWAEPMRNELMHEIGLRILIRKCQLVGMQYDKALIPIFTQSSDHYVRVYLHAEKSKEVIKTIRHGFVAYCNSCGSHAVSKANVGTCCKKPVQVAGPMWLGMLWNHELVKDMLKAAPEHLRKFLHTIHQESHIPQVGFYDIHKLCSRMKLVVPKTEPILEALRKKGYHATITHFSPTGIRTDAPLDVVKKILR